MSCDFRPVNKLVSPSRKAHNCQLTIALFIVLAFAARDSWGQRERVPMTGKQKHSNPFLSCSWVPHLWQPNFFLEAWCNSVMCFRTWWSEPRPGRRQQISGLL